MSSGTDRLTPLFEPRSIAIVGASNDVTKLSGRLLLNLRRYPFAGEVFPINAARDTVLGERAYPDLNAIGSVPDLTMIATSAERTLDAAREAIACGTRAIVAFAAGFSEFGAEGAERERALADLAREKGTILLGPNTAGLMNGHAALCGSFSTVTDQAVLRPGGLSFAGQSGAIGAYWLDAVLAAGLGCAKWLSTGNEAGIDLADAVAVYAADPQTETICLYIEGPRDILRLHAALRAARAAGKPVLALRAGRSAAGAAAAVSHTGALASPDALWRALFEQEQVIDCRSLGEMIDVARFIRTRPSGPIARPLVVTVSGGAGALMADSLSDEGVELADLPVATRERLREALPRFGDLHNPLDLTAAMAVDTGILEAALTVVHGDDDYDGFIIILGLMAESHPRVIAAIAAQPKALGRPLALVWLAASPATRQALAAADLVAFDDLPAAARALGSWNRHAAGRLRTADIQPRQVRVAGEALSEIRGQGLLGADLLIRYPRGWLLQDEGEAPPADASDGPVAVKLQSGRIPHKTELGAVELGVSSDALAAAMARMWALARTLDLTVDGVLVQEMVAHEHELLVGLRIDPQFGPLLVLGRGGTAAEYERDTAMRLLPVDRADVIEMLDGLRYADRLRGIRGRATIDLDRLAEALVSLADLFLRRDDIAEIEINPLGVSAPDSFVALDLLVTPTAS